MKNWGTICPDGQIERQTNPVRITIGNPTEEQKELCAKLLGQLEIVDTSEPPYNQETQYTVYHYEPIDGKAVRVWEIKDKPAPEPTLDERVDNLEEAVDSIIGGETEA